MVAMGEVLRIFTFPKIKRNLCTCGDWQFWFEIFLKISFNKRWSKKIFKSSFVIEIVNLTISVITIIIWLPWSFVFYIEILALIFKQPVIISPCVIEAIFCIQACRSRYSQGWMTEATIADSGVDKRSLVYSNSRGGQKLPFIT